MNKKGQLLQAVKYGLIAASAGIIQAGSFTLFEEVLHWEYWPSYLTALVLSVLWNFTFNRKYTFRSDYDIRRAMLLTLLFYVIFTPVSTWWTAALTGENPFTGAAANEATALVSPWIVQIGTMLVNFVLEFLWQRLVVYRNRVDTKM